MMDLRFQLILILFIGISTVSSKSPPISIHYHCSASLPKKNDSIPLLKDFSAFILAECPYSSLDWEIFLNQVQEHENVSIVNRTNMDGLTTMWLMNYTDQTATIVDSNGEGKHMNMSDDDWANENPLNISKNFLTFHEKPPKSLLELIRWAQNEFNGTFISNSNETFVHGMEGVHYISCRIPSLKTPEKNGKIDTEPIVEVEIVYPNVNEADKLNRKDVPMSLELKSFSKNDTHTNVHDYVRFNFYRVLNATLPPSIKIELKETQNGYKATSMVALGICMTLIGFVLGAFALFVWKRYRARRGAGYVNQYDDE